MRVLTIALGLLLPCFAFSQNTQISGVITYFFNDYQGNKPDIGAKVYLVPEGTIETDKLKCIDSLINVRTLSNLGASYLRMEVDYLGLAARYANKKRMKEEYDKYMKSADEMKSSKNMFMDSVKKYHCETKEGFDALALRANAAFHDVTVNSLSEKSVDGSGSYSFNVKPGSYYVVVQSKNRTQISVAEILGSLYVKKVTVQDGGSKDVSNNFSLQ